MAATTMAETESERNAGPKVTTSPRLKTKLCRYGDKCRYGPEKCRFRHEPADSAAGACLPVPGQESTKQKEAPSKAEGKPLAKQHQRKGGNKKETAASEADAGASKSKTTNSKAPQQDPTNEINPSPEKKHEKQKKNNKKVYKKACWNGIHCKKVDCHFYHPPVRDQRLRDAAAKNASGASGSCTPCPEGASDQPSSENGEQQGTSNAGTTGSQSLPGGLLTVSELEEQELAKQSPNSEQRGGGPVWANQLEEEMLRNSAAGANDSNQHASLEGQQRNPKKNNNKNKKKNKAIRADASATTQQTEQQQPPRQTVPATANVDANDSGKVASSKPQPQTKRSTSPKPKPSAAKRSTSPVPPAAAKRSTSPKPAAGKRSNSPKPPPKPQQSDSKPAAEAEPANSKGKGKKAKGKKGAAGPAGGAQTPLPPEPYSGAATQPDASADGKAAVLPKKQPQKQVKGGVQPSNGSKNPAPRKVPEAVKTGSEQPNAASVPDKKGKRAKQGKAGDDSEARSDQTGEASAGLGKPQASPPQNGAAKSVGAAAAKSATVHHKPTAAASSPTSADGSQEKENIAVGVANKQKEENQRVGKKNNVKVETVHPEEELSTAKAESVASQSPQASGKADSPTAAEGQPAASDEESVVDAPPTPAAETDAERKRRWQEELRQQKLRAQEKAKDKKKNRHQRYLQELERQHEERKSFWTAQVEMEKTAVKMIVILLASEFCRKRLDIDWQKLMENVSVMKKLEEQAKRTFRELFADDIQSRIVVKGSGNKDLDDRVGIIQNWDESKGKFQIGLETKKAKNLEEVFLLPSFVEAHTSRTAIKKKRVDVEPSSNVKIPSLYKQEDLNYELDKSTVKQLIEAKSVDEFLNRLSVQRTQDELEARRREEEERKQEEEARRRRAEKLRQENEEWERQKKEFAQRKERLREMRRERKRAQQSPFGGGRQFGQSHARSCRCRECELEREFAREFFEDYFGRRGPSFFFNVGGFTFSFGGGGPGGGDEWYFEDDDDEEDRWEQEFGRMHEEEKREKNAKAADLLGVAEDAKEDDVNRAFRRLSLKYHPDKYRPENHADGATRKDAEEMFKRLSDARDEMLNYRESHF